MNVLLMLTLFLAGAVLGVLYFGGLRLTVDRLKSSKSPVTLYFASLVIRFSVLAVSTLLALQIGVAYLISATVGFFMTRFVMIARNSVNRKEPCKPMNPIQKGVS